VKLDYQKKQTNSKYLRYWH